MQDVLFIVGCPRSGTTWVQLLLAQHPAVATANETFLFYRYVGDLWREWEAEEDRFARPLGLRQLLDEERFTELCRAFADEVIREIASPGSSVVVEKTPGHVTSAELILRCFPNAAFLHVVRDPRDVACSLMAAEASWAEGWAPGNAHDAAHLWRELVTEGRRIAEMTDRYREVRYEDLHRDAPGELAEILAWLELSHADAFCDEAARSVSIERMSGSQRGDGADDRSGGRRPWDTGQEPDGFFRKGTSGSWREELTRRQLHTIEFVTASAMTRFGYETTSRMLAVPPVAELRRRLARRLRGALGTLGRRR